MCAMIPMLRVFWSENLRCMLLILVRCWAALRAKK
jgi:hypothetical protein